MTTRANPYDVQTSEDAEQAAYLRQWAQQHPTALRRRPDWRGLFWRIAYLVILGVGLAFTLPSIYLGLFEPGPWAALSTVGTLLLTALMLAGRGRG